MDWKFAGDFWDSHTFLCASGWSFAFVAVSEISGKVKRGKTADDVATISPVQFPFVAKCHVFAKSFSVFGKTPRLPQQIFCSWQNAMCRFPLIFSICTLYLVQMLNQNTWLKPRVQHDDSFYALKISSARFSAAVMLPWILSLPSLSAIPVFSRSI